MSISRRPNKFTSCRDDSKGRGYRMLAHDRVDQPSVVEITEGERYEHFRNQSDGYRSSPSS
jgi:hypothetical protein